MWNAELFINSWRSIPYPIKKLFLKVKEYSSVFTATKVTQEKSDQLAAILNDIHTGRNRQAQCRNESGH